MFKNWMKFLTVFVIAAGMLIIGGTKFPSTRPIIEEVSYLEIYQHMDTDAMKIYGYDDESDSHFVMGWNGSDCFAFASDADFSFAATNIGLTGVTTITGVTAIVGATGITGNLDISAGADITGTVTITTDLYGAEINDQHTYMLAEAIYGQNANVAHSLMIGWLTTPADAGTEQDLSPDDNDATYKTCTWTAADQLYDDFAYALDLDGTNDHLTCADDATWFMDDNGGANGCTIGGVFEITNTAAVQSIMGQWDISTGAEARTFKLIVDAAEKIQLLTYDESANIETSYISDAAVAVGYHVIHVMYPGSGGATNHNATIIYVDGVAVAGTAANDGSYVGMEDLAGLLWIGATESTGGVAELFFAGNMGFLFFTADQFSADEVWDSFLTLRAFYNL